MDGGVHSSLWDLLPEDRDHPEAPADAGDLPENPLLEESGQVVADGPRAGDPEALPDLADGGRGASGAEPPPDKAKDLFLPRREG